MNLELKNITKSYDGQTVLQDINISLADVRAVGVIGESGCGKSTLLRLLAGIELPDCGEIEINKMSPIHDKIAFQKKIGVVFQKHNLFPHLTLQKNISLILQKTKKLDKRTANAKAMSLLEKLFIETEADKKPSQVSGGQAQRCAIARAIATEPELILLDEPTAALDPVLTSEVLKSITTLKQEGTHFIFVTHEISFLKEFADYIIFFEKGKICEHGDISCLQNPKTNELKHFLNIGEQ